MSSPAGSSPSPGPSPGPSSFVASALAAAVAAAVATTVGARADLAALLDEWEEAQRGRTERLLSILTR